MIEQAGPKSIGIIMDGNRRWAKAKGLSSARGHQAGEEVLLRLLDDYRPLRDAWGAAHYIFYTFSTENRNRAEAEVADLLGLFEHAFSKIEERLPQLLSDGVRMRFLGERGRFSGKLQEMMNELEAKTAGGAEGTIALAVSYGGRPDILQAANGLMAGGAKEITEVALTDALWTRGIPEPDLIIRTGGEKRLSNFLLWESAYAELAFTDTLWPDFSRKELERIFADFASRERRHGR
ncbi:MAG: polyprenyl diphosphate synthase [bacterium]